MRSVADLITPANLAELATPGNLRLGQEIAAAGEVEFTEFTPEKVTAKVGGETTGTRHISLNAGNDGLSWHCSCTSDPKLFCKHLAAAALEIWKKSPHTET